MSPQYRPDPLPEGLEQLSGFLDRLSLDGGTLILFDGWREAPPLPERCSIAEVQHHGKRIELVRL